jgi:hypothetical protein
MNEKYNFITRQEMVPTGPQFGAIADLKVEQATEKSAKNHYILTLLLQLEAARKNGMRWIVAKKYVLNSRGLAVLLNDLTMWTGRIWTSADMDDFDPEVTFYGKTVQILIHNKKVNGKLETVPGGLLPTGAKVVKVSDNFVREKDQVNQPAQPAKAAVLMA